MPMLRYDYDSVLDRLKQKTLRKLNGQDLLLFSTNSAFLEVVAEEIDDLALYDEFLTRENVWETARGTSSIMKQVDRFDYRPHRKIGATGIIRFSTNAKDFDGNYPDKIPLPKWTQVSGGGLTFLTKEEAFLHSTDHWIDVPVIQGEVTKYLITISSVTHPQGTAYAQIPIYDPDIENTIYEVKVEGRSWKEIANIRLAVQEPDPKEAEVYSIRTMPQYNGVILFFGNGMLGKSLQYGNNIEFTYLKTKGLAGNVLSRGVVTTVDSTIKVPFTEEPINLYCTNQSALAGGQDYELLSDIKANAPRSFQTGNRAISSLDYEILIRKTGTVINVQVWGEKEINEDRGNPPGTYIATAENLIYITGYTVDSNTGLGIPITESKAIILEYLNDKKGTTDILQFVDTQIIYVTFKPTIFIKDTRYTFEQVREFVHKALESRYSIYRGVYKEGLYLSDYYAVIDSVTGVDHCTCTLELSIMALFTSKYEFSANINLNNIEKESVSIKIKTAGMEWMELARADKNGNFVGSIIDSTQPDSAGNRFSLPGATINYQDGSIGDVIVTSGLTKPYEDYQIRIDFKLDAAEGGDLKPTLRNQLFAWYADEIQTRLMI